MDDAGRAGGGIVYLPAGWYKVSSHLKIPTNVELRGASSVPNRDQNGLSGGTVLFAYEGRNTDSPETETAFITINGDCAGIRGLRVFYPENNPASEEGIVPYPYTIRGNGTETYAINIGLPNSYNAIDFGKHRNDQLFIRKIAGVYFNNGVVIGDSKNGRLEGILSNGNAVTRVGYRIPGWAVESNVFPQVIDKYTRMSEDLIVVDGAENLNILNAFAYGSKQGVYVNSGQVQIYNLGTDNLGAGGYSVNVDNGEVQAMNVMRYNGDATLNGMAELHNILVIGLVQNSVNVTAMKTLVK